MTQTVWIARHGNRLDFATPDWFLTAERPYDPPLYDGEDIPHQPNGFKQAKRLGERLKREKITHIFASPFLRTVQTANEVAEALDLPIKVESGLSEWLNPHWMPSMPEKLPIEALHELYPRIDLSYTSRVIPEYPETGERALARSGETAKRLAAEFPENILLVGHGVSMIGMTMGLLGVTAKPEINATLCCLVKVVRQGEEWVMELNGDTSHLSETEKVIRFH